MMRMVSIWILDDEEMSSRAWAKSMQGVAAAIDRDTYVHGILGMAAHQQLQDGPRDYRT